ncbi:MAG: branched-chain amino acid ABC transporter permease, partial [Betaproteobacteria bacterium]|nr:branched-chain amino acid ABC transporter permease [Betaproteobacteria bacterium]
KWTSLTGGANGLPGIHYPNVGIPEFTLNTLSFYYFVAALVGVCLAAMYRLTESPFGYALQGIKGDEDRMRCLGYNTWRHKYLIFVVAGFFAGIAGTLFASYSGLMAPEHLGVKTSTLAMLMVIIGGDRMFWGPALGAAVVVLIEHYASLYVPARWPLILGGVFVAAVMFLRGGIGMHLANIWQRSAGGSWKR